jgi:hypothetical protein
MACEHGREGFCFDEASVGEREHHTFAHAHAYAWAVLREKLPRDEAEAYATWYAEREYRFATVDMEWHFVAYGEWKVSA